MYIVAWYIGCRKGIEGGDVGEDDVQEGREDYVQEGPIFERSLEYLSVLIPDSVSFKMIITEHC